MCNFFSCVVTRDGRILFTEQDSHSEIISRAGLRDTELFMRDFVPPFDNVRVDESGTLPGWYEDSRVEIEKRALLLAQRIGVLFDQYKALKQAAWADYDAKISKIEGFVKENS